MENNNGSCAHAMLEAKKLVMVFSDGTWCGQLTGTETNVKLLANVIAGGNVKVREKFTRRLEIDIDSNTATINSIPSKFVEVVGCYFDGEGVQGGFSDYILDGALGGKIKDGCMEIYKFIMHEFETSDLCVEVWMVGLSRGSYTVRCVAGMINNCGIVDKKVVEKQLGREPSDLEMDDILDRAYEYYRGRTDMYMPESNFMVEWKRKHSRARGSRPPVKFMGLFETVGSLGIPSLDPGEGVDYFGDLNFYGKPEEGASAISGEVERVYQALAIHDRLTAFSPCHVKRDKAGEDFFYNKDKEKGNNLPVVYETEEMWFPGAHYDIGRQHFKFYKTPKLSISLLLKPAELVNKVGQCALSFLGSRVLRIPEIYPNYEYSQDVLQWITKKMVETDPLMFKYLQKVLDGNQSISETKPNLLQRALNFMTFKPHPLTHDAYDNLESLIARQIPVIPFANNFLVGTLNRYFLKNRLICDPPPNNLEPPAPPIRFRPGNKSDLQASKNYRSRSYDSYQVECNIIA